MKKRKNPFRERELAQYIVAGFSVCILLLLMFMLSYGRTQYQAGGAGSYKEFAAAEHGVKQYVLPLIPEDAENIRYTINTTGVVFEVSFQLPPGRMEEFLGNLPEDEVKTQRKMQNETIASLSGSVLIGDGLYWNKFCALGQKAGLITCAYDRQQQRIYLISFSGSGDRMQYRRGYEY